VLLTKATPFRGGSLLSEKEKGKESIKEINVYSSNIYCLIMFNIDVVYLMYSLRYRVDI